MIQITEIPECERHFLYRLYSVKLLQQMTLPDADNNFHIVYANTISHRNDGCNYWFYTSDKIEVCLNANYFKPGKNEQFFKYLSNISDIYKCSHCGYENIEQKFTKEYIMGCDPFTKCKMQIPITTGCIYKCPHCENVVHSILNKQ